MKELSLPVLWISIVTVWHLFQQAFLTGYVELKLQGVSFRSEK